jgi:hypothetical protein
MHARRASLKKGLLGFGFMVGLLCPGVIIVESVIEFEVVHH